MEGRKQSGYARLVTSIKPLKHPRPALPPQPHFAKSQPTMIQHE